MQKIAKPLKKKPWTKRRIKKHKKQKEKNV